MQTSAQNEAFEKAFKKVFVWGGVPEEEIPPEKEPEWVVPVASGEPAVPPEFLHEEEGEIKPAIPLEPDWENGNPQNPPPIDAAGNIYYEPLAL